MERFEKFAFTINTLHDEAMKMLNREKSIKAELYALQSRHKEAMELLEAAVADILSFDSRPCKLCKFGNATWIMPNHCEDCDSLETTKTNWKWQHADRYKALKEQENE